MAEVHISGGPGGGGEKPNGSKQDDNSNGSEEDSLVKPVKDNDAKKSSSKEGTGVEEESSVSSAAVPSTALTQATGASIASSASHQLEVDHRRETLQHQMMILSIATATTMAIFVTTVVPFTILIAFGMFAASAGLLSYATLQRLILEYQEIVAGNGLAQFLPPSAMEMLTQTSLHQFMRDDTFVREWGFLAIYFVPGLTEDQLNQYIRRLAPDRQVFLNRPGMGYFLGDGFMRALVGERRWRQEAIVANVPTIEHPTNQEIVVRSRGLDLDSDAESEAPTTGPVGLTVPRESPQSAENERIVPNPPNDEERRRQLAGEGDVLMNALTEGISNYVNAVTVAASQFARDQMLFPIGDLATTVGLASSIGVTVLSFGAGMWRFSRPPTRGEPTSPLISGILVSATMLGGLSTGVMLYARSAIRRAKPPPPPPAFLPPLPPPPK